MNQDIQTVLEQAERAQVEADRAAAKATKLREQAELAQQRKVALERENRARYSEAVIARFPQDRDAASESYSQAYRQFVEAVRSMALERVIARYMDWRKSGLAEYYVFFRFHDALGFLGIETYNGASIPSTPNRMPISLSSALDKALEQVLQDENAELGDRFQAEIQAVTRGEMPSALVSES